MGPGPGLFLWYFVPPKEKGHPGDWMPFVVDSGPESRLEVTFPYQHSNNLENPFYIVLITANHDLGHQDLDHQDPGHQDLGHQILNLPQLARLISRLFEPDLVQTPTMPPDL